MSTITVVCTANICRSPMAEAVLQAKLNISGMQATVNSAGVQALTGRRPASNTITVLNQANYPLSESKTAEQLLPPLANQTNLILVMEQRHKQWVMQNFPSASGKVWLLAHWLAEQEIADPIGKEVDAFEACLKRIEEACDSWLPKLKAIL